MSDEGRLVAGRYRIVGKIGSGAMGAVWRAHDEVLGRTVAIKQLLLQPGLENHEAEDARQRTMREGRIAARLHHPNAITVFDVVTDDNGQPCLIMEYLDSTSLAQVLQEKGTLPPLEVARIGAQIAAALREAHAVGIVHRDIKPGNILLAGNGTVKITDFGISRAKDDVTVTKTGMIAGTPAYLAPEVAIGGDPGPESDVFSLGSTLYAACEGQPPFGLSENTLSLLHAVAAGQINPPRQSGPLASVLAVLLHPETQHRPTADECEELLAAVARGETPLGGPDGDTMMASSSGTLGAAALGAAGGAAAAGLLHPDDEQASHSGTLLDDPGVTQQYDPSAQQYYDEDPYPPGSGYPEDDYDDHGYQQDGYHQEPPLYGDPSRNGLAATRAVPVPDHYEDDPYDEDPAPRTRVVQTAPEDDEDEKPGAWKKPAIIGGVVVVGLVALGVWLLTPGNPPDASQPAPPVSSSAVAPTSVTQPPSEATTTSPPTSSRESATRETQSTRHSRRTTTAEDTPTQDQPSQTRVSQTKQSPTKPPQSETSATAPPTATS
ncbi:MULTISPECIES: serine/threonine-protein kinase [Amycolatopsis]|uniref:non-specific serine/threonine protein kinase n=1 Tax=Amycolatopsis dendrobii TaxID=2760662 RepID=A0A7W3W3S7_9PSEU|nr:MULTISPECIES: serine/threonine-protein kinase [Amycolatopsis]MBB1157777.1 protein kinase [Amycolatopsis dendrobii]UKD54043.1 protein kinase [Amycolatopsis sp. FU40]